MGYLEPGDICPFCHKRLTYTDEEFYELIENWIFYKLSNEKLGKCITYNEMARLYTQEQHWIVGRICAELTTDLKDYLQQDAASDLIDKIKAKYNKLVR